MKSNQCNIDGEVNVTRRIIGKISKEGTPEIELEGRHEGNAGVPPTIDVCPHAFHGRTGRKKKSAPTSQRIRERLQGKYRRKKRGPSLDHP